MEDFFARPMQGYFLVNSKGSQAVRYAHELCGKTNFKGAVSPNSGKPLLQLLALDASDPRLELSGAGIHTLPLLYSWTCPISQGVFSYQVSPGRSIGLIQYIQGTPYVDFPYAGYPDAFPARPINLDPLSSAQQEAIRRLNSCEESLFVGEAELSDEEGELTDLDRPRHQVGGNPRLMQAPYDLRCPHCKVQMPILASIANENDAPRGFADNPFVQVVYYFCRSCSVISCYHIVD